MHEIRLLSCYKMQGKIVRKDEELSSEGAGIVAFFFRDLIVRIMLASSLRLSTEAVALAMVRSFQVALCSYPSIPDVVTTSA